MDKLKQSLGPILAHGFWIGTAILLIGSLATWFLATSSLSDENAKRTTELNNAHASVDSIRGGINEHPNDDSHRVMQTMISQRKADVLTAWKDVFSRQERILVWPAEVLGQEVVDEFQDKMPIEVHLDFSDVLDPTQEVDSDILVRYAEHIEKTMPKVAEIAGTEWTASMERSGGMEGMDMEASMNMGMDGGMMEGGAATLESEEDAPLVVWSGGSQSQVVSDLFPWLGNRPTTLEVYYSQENIWILTQMMEIVAEMNKGARLPFESKIHEINSLAIGKSVNFDGGVITEPGKSGGAGGGYGGDEMEMGMDMDMGMDMEDYGSTGSGVGSVGPDPADSRYVDTENKPITGAELRTALKAETPQNPMLAVAKRVPVMMSFQVDQRYIHKLLATCGSVPLMVDVQQVRILPKRSSGAGGMGEGMMEEAGMEMDSGMGMGMGMTAAPSGPEDPYPLDMTVEIYGLIYIYNPPDEKKIGVEQQLEATASAPPAGSTPISQNTPVPDRTQDPVSVPQAILQSARVALATTPVR